MQKSSSLTSSFHYNVSQKTKVVLMSLLFLLNIVIRIPSIPHEKGYDSFFIHSLANSISYFGDARWWINSMSIFGLYPYSYSSAVPFSLSGISQLTGIPVEKTILLFCVFLGIFSIFTSYALSSVFYDNFIYRLIFSFIFSISAGTVNLTTWEITTRAQFLVFFPLLLYIVFKLLHNGKTFLIPLFLLITFIFATHHYAYFAVFFVVVLIAVFLFHKLNSKIQIKNHYIPRFNENFAFLLILVTVLAIPFFFRDQLGLIKEGSRYAWILSIITQSIRNLGIMFPFSIGGIIYLSLKKTKKFEDWSVLVCLIPTFFFSYNQTYGYLITYLLMIIFCAEGMVGLIRNYMISKRKFVLVFMALILILNTSFSGFFNHWHAGLAGGYSEWYMREESYVSGEWIKQNLNHDTVALYSGYEAARMASSYGDRPLVFRDDMLNCMYGITNVNESNILKNSVFSSSYYFDNPYVLQGGSSPTGALAWMLGFPVTDLRARNFINAYNASYFFQDTSGYGSSNVFVTSLDSNENKIQESGRIRVWML